MFDLAGGWRKRMAGAVLPGSSEKAGWSVAHSVEAAFVEPVMHTIEGSPLTARTIVVAAPGAVGKSTFARILAAETSSVLVDLSRTEQLGGNFFIGGIANAFGVSALKDAQEGRLGLVIDALDEAQLRAGGEGFANGLSDLSQIIRHGGALPAVLFGRSAAAEEAWLVLKEADLDPCLLEIEFFDEPRAVEYIEKKLRVIAGRRPKSMAAYDRHTEAFLDLAIATRAKLIETPGGDDPRFAGYAPVLDAVCSYAMESESLNPQARIAQLSANSPVDLIAKIAEAILKREQGKLVDQLREEVSLEGVDTSILYAPEEQLGRLASALIDAPAPAGSTIERPEVKRAYDRMIADFAPTHPFRDARSGFSNAAFAAYVLVWALRGAAQEAARTALISRPGLGSGLFFELYMLSLNEALGADGKKGRLELDLADVGPLFAAFMSQAGQREEASLDITGEDDDVVVEIAFDIDSVATIEGSRHYGPFLAPASGVLALRGPVANVRVSAPISLVLGDGSAVNVTAPVDIDVELLQVDGREVRIFKSVVNSTPELQQVTLIAREAVVDRVETVIVLGGKLSVSFPSARRHPWNEYAVVLPVAPSRQVETLRRRLRRVLTAFQRRGHRGLVRLAAKIDDERMMKRDELGPRLIRKLREDGILTTFDAGKYYALHPEELGPALNMDYQALQQQRWSRTSDAYLERLVR